jgi:hypothetical protein
MAYIVHSPINKHKSTYVFEQLSQMKYISKFELSMPMNKVHNKSAVDTLLLDNSIPACRNDCL